MAGLPNRRIRRFAAITIGDLNLQQEILRLVQLTAFGGPSARLARKPPRLMIRKSPKAPRYLSDLDVEDGYIKVVDWPGLKAESAAVSLLWCLAWFSRDGDDRWGHHRAFIRAFEEAWPGVAGDGRSGRRPLVDMSSRKLSDAAQRGLATEFARRRRTRTQASRAVTKGA
jgi:hypothetical protein